MGASHQGTTRVYRRNPSLSRSALGGHPWLALRRLLARIAPQAARAAAPRPVGALFRTGGNLPISLVATGLVAVLFQPLRDRFQRGINRILYGERDEPYAVVARLGQRLEATLAPDAVLPALVETVAQALKLPYVAVLLKQEDGFVTVAEYPDKETRRQGVKENVDSWSPDLFVSLSLTYQGEMVGNLLLAPRTAGEGFSPADRRLLTVLAQQAGVAAHTVQLTTDLQQSRERLIMAREEERRRLRRDLHDGVGPTLASMAQRIDAATYIVRDNPDEAIALLQGLKGQVRSTLADIRRLVYALRPPALDELGLLAAVREHAAQVAGGSDLQVLVEAPEALPPLPAAVELAAYRIALEALTNVVRHAQARSCRIRFAVVNADSRPGLRVEICDDGVGLPADHRVGVGLTSMREREVLELIAQGHSNPAMAERLVLSVKTVQNHVSSILGKLQAADRAQVIVRARNAGFGKGGTA